MPAPGACPRQWRLAQKGPRLGTPPPAEMVDVPRAPAVGPAAPGCFDGLKLPEAPVFPCFVGEPVPRD
eukprot:8629288-Prorocentrum_lima.AAC.1